MNFTIELLSPKGTINPVGTFSEVPSQGISEGRFFTILESNELKNTKISLTFGVYIEGKLIEEVTSSFIAPDLKVLQDKSGVQK